MRSLGSRPRITQQGLTGSAHLLWSISPHKNGLRIKYTLLRVGHLHNTTIATAIADRLVENSEVFLLGGDSIRKPKKPAA